jgi:hypothetical protein
LSLSTAAEIATSAVNLLMRKQKMKKFIMQRFKRVPNKSSWLLSSRSSLYKTLSRYLLNKMSPSLIALGTVLRSNACKSL